MLSALGVRVVGRQGAYWDTTSRRVAAAQARGKAVAGAIPGRAFSRHFGHTIAAVILGFCRLFIISRAGIYAIPQIFDTRATDFHRRRQKAASFDAAPRRFRRCRYSLLPPPLYSAIYATAARRRALMLGSAPRHRMRARHGFLEGDMRFRYWLERCTLPLSHARSPPPRLAAWARSSRWFRHDD